MSKVYLVAADRSDPEGVIADKLEALWRAAGLGACFHPKDLTALKLYEETLRTTRANGRLLFHDLPPGAHEVTAHLPDGTVESRTAEVTEKGATVSRVVVGD